MKRILLPLLVVLAIGLLGALLWFQTRRSTPADANRATEVASDARGNTKLDDREHGLTAPESDGAKAERASAMAAANAAQLGQKIVEGEVRAPADCMVDTDVEVFALARPTDLDTLMMAIGPRRADGSSPGDSDPKFVVARAKLDANGRFRLALPKESAKAHLICAGRAWLNRETLTVDVSKANTLVALQAECGGWIAAKVDLPAGATSANVLDGEIAQLSLSLANFTGGPGRMGAAFRRNERRASVKDGRLELWALDPDQAYTLDLSTSAFADATTEVAEIARGQATQAQLRLERGGSVQGRVVDADSKPIAGATVEATISRGPFGFGERTVRKGTTAADGTYVLAAVVPGSVQVSARSKELPASEAQKVDVVDKSVVSGIDFALGAGETIAGVVRWKDGTPAAGAEVSVSGDRGQGGGPGQFRIQMRRSEDPKFVADKDGRFLAKGLAAGSYALAAESLKPEDAAKIDEGDVDARRRLAWRARAAGVKSGTSDTVLTLEAPLVVRGVVTSQVDGKPVPVFRVQANNADGGGGRRGGGGGGGMAFAFGGNQRTSQDVNNERGEFTFTFQREGSYKLTISSDGFVTSDGIDVEVPVKPDAAPLAIALARGAILQGVVRSPLGTPVANATVAPVTSGGGMFGGRGFGAPEDSIKARTDADGRFTLSELKAGRLVLVAESSAWSKSDELGLDIVAGATISDAVLVLHQGGSIVGESYEDGRPAAGRGITAMDMKSFASASARTDAAGRFRLDHLAPGAWRVTAMPAASELQTLGQGGPGGRGGGDGGMGAMFSKMKSANADVVEAQETHVVLGAPPEAPVAVRGKVTQGGAPVGGVRVTFMGQGDSFGPGMKTAQSGADGMYAIQLDKPGDYSITVQQGGGRASLLEFVETVKAGAEAVVDLALPTARISGRVRTPEGDPARGIRVSLYASSMGVGGSMMGGGFNEITTDDDGNFDINTLRAGAYTLSVGGSMMGGFRGPGGSGDSKYGRKVVEDIQLAESEWRKNVDVRLDNAAGVDVEVLDDRGAPVIGASIFARDDAGRAVDRMSTVRTDANGKARYAGLSPGAHTFSARKDSLSSGESTKVDVRSTGTSSVKITLSQGTLLYVTTTDANDEPLRARVSVTDEAGRDVAGLMSAQDMMERMTRAGPGGNEQKIGPLAPGKYKVKAVATDGKTVEKSVTLTGQAERKMTISFGG